MQILREKKIIDCPAVWPRCLAAENQQYVSWYAASSRDSHSEYDWYLVCYFYNNVMAEKSQFWRVLKKK